MPGGRPKKYFTEEERQEARRRDRARFTERIRVATERSRNQHLADTPHTSGSASTQQSDRQGSYIQGGAELREVDADGANELNEQDAGKRAALSGNWTSSREQGADATEQSYTEVLQELDRVGLDDFPNNPTEEVGGILSFRTSSAPSEVDESEGRVRTVDGVEPIPTSQEDQPGLLEQEHPQPVFNRNNDTVLQQIEVALEDGGSDIRDPFALRGADLSAVSDITDDEASNTHDHARRQYSTRIIDYRGSRRKVIRKPQAVDLAQFIQESFTSAQFCHCSYPNLNTEGLTMTEVVEHWSSAFPRLNQTYDLLDSPATMLQYRCEESDITQVHWRDLLCKPLKLSYAKTQARAATRGALVYKRYDVDSAVFVLTSLAAFRTALSVNLLSVYLAQLPGPFHTDFNGHEVYRCKHTILGSGVSTHGVGFKLAIVFPSMQISKRTRETAFSEIEAETWVDQILLPSIFEVCPSNVTARWSKRYREEKMRSEAAKESSLGSSGSKFPMRHPIRAEFLGRIWDRIIERCAAPASYHPRLPSGSFAEPILVLWAHGVKAVFDGASIEGAVSSFHSYINDALNMDHVDLAQSWLDIGLDICPKRRRTSDPGITLLPRSECIKEWGNKFKGVDGLASTTTSTYLFASTRDSCGINVITGKRSPFRTAGLAVAKAYPVYKDTLTTKVSKHHILKDSQFSALGLNQDSIDQVYKEVKSNTSRLRKLEVQKRYLQVKERVNEALCTPGLAAEGEKDFPLRFEYRVRYDVAQQVRGGGGDGRGAQRRAQSSRGPADTHTCYWALPTSEVKRFVAGSFRRLAWPIEIASLLADKKHSGIHHEFRDRLTFEEQLENSALISALMAWIGTLDNCNILQTPRLWKERIVPRAQLGKQPNETDEEARTRQERASERGLHLENSVRTFGCAHLSESILDTSGLVPRIQPRILQKFAYSPAFLRERVRLPTSNLVNLKFSDKLLVYLHDVLVKSSSHPTARRFAFRLGAGIAISAYIEDVFDVLVERYRDHARHSDRSLSRLTTPDARRELLRNLTPDERRGLCGLDSVMITRICEKPCIASVKGTIDKMAPKTLIFQDFDSKAWRGRIAPMFAVKHTCKPVWYKKQKYYAITERVINLVNQVLGPAAQDEALQFLYSMAPRCIWIALHYEWASQFSSLLKVNHHAGADRQQEIKSMSPFERTQFIIPCAEGPVAAAYTIARDAAEPAMAPTDAEFAKYTQTKCQGQDSKLVRLLDRTCFAFSDLETFTGVVQELEDAASNASDDTFAESTGTP